MKVLTWLVLSCAALGIVAAASACSSDDDKGGTGSPNLSAHCSTYCGNAAALPCTNDSAAKACVDECLIIGQKVTTCSEKWEAALSCVNDTASLSCSASGGVSISGCTQERGEVDSCIDVATEAACKGYCAKMVVLPCATQDQASCEANCASIFKMLPCDMETLIAFSCAAERGVMECSDGGGLAVTGCDEEQKAMTDCHSAGAVVVDPPDSGTPETGK